MRTAQFLLIAILVCISLDTFPQQRSDQNNSNQKNEISGVWKYEVGDNLLGATIDLNDSNWKSIELSEPVKTSLLSFGNINWLRKVIAPAVLQNDSLFSLTINQFGASEIYVNGALIYSIGKITSPTQFLPYNPHFKVFPITLKRGQKNTLAIRFATKVPKSEWIISRYLASPASIPPLIVKLQTLKTAITQREVFLNERLAKMGPIFLTAIFGVLFLLLYLFYPKEKLHLFFSLFNLFLLSANLLQKYFDTAQYGLYDSVYLIVTQTFVSRLIGMSVLLFMIYALNITRTFIWWYIIFVLLIDFPLTLILPVQYLLVSSTVRLLIIPICMWLTYHAFSSKRKEDFLIGLIAMLVISVNVSFAMQQFWGIDTAEYLTHTVPIITFILTVFYVAIRYSRTNKFLERQIVQVKHLSAENLRQEQEKQGILSSQKELLEKQVAERTSELNQQKKELQNTLENLKSTQTQLIQSEKMASLGELTAGIAHEIQNPLNFVNNFSEVNKELAEELEQELDKGNYIDAKTIAKDIKDNEEKINHHGKRADAIVKGMLQHSRSNSGVKEPTDINALCDEYLRLSYHGLRARDKSFNATIKTDFDTSLEKIDIIPQDIGRVILNLLTNAFYVVNEKKKAGIENYEPTVTISTKKMGDKLEIKVSDNGNGIPQKVLDKIFQPFFTTKPTGQGTGLGLSLSYDIIKAHVGELKVETEERKGSTFIIKLPA